jgi:hypothetical protein
MARPSRRRTGNRTARSTGLKWPFPRLSFAKERGPSEDSVGCAPVMVGVDFLSDTARMAMSKDREADFFDFRDLAVILRSVVVFSNPSGASP